MPAALLMSAAVAGQALGATWNLPVHVQISHVVFLDGLVSLENQTAVAVYVECRDSDNCYSVVTRRTTDGGATWQAPVELTTDGYWASIGGRGQMVDVTWVDSEGNVRYSRSRDGGVSYGPPKVVARGHAANSSVGRGPGGLVAIAWVSNPNGGTLNVRISTDGGASFGPRRRVNAHTEGSGNPLAVGDGVVYVAFGEVRDSESEQSLRVSRSVDRGQTWQSELLDDVSGRDLYKALSIAAEGDKSFVSFPTHSGALVARQTTDKGASWQPPVRLSSPYDFRANPDVALNDGTVRVTYNARSGIYFRTSQDGSAWSPAERVTEIGGAAQVGFAGHPLALYNVFVREGQYEIRSRTRAP
jgi:hypothetical protein